MGVGASAGGLEAFEQFFRHVPPDSGMAFVLVSHLDPSHASHLTEILQRSTTMPVIEAQDQTAVAPNCVYVIPPNRDMAIFRGALQLSVPDQPRGQRMPIDSFLRSLAEDRGERAIGVILSGTGTDGTLGLRAILGAGGVTLVQEPATAKYDGMPASAVQAGYGTHVLPVEGLPRALLDSMRHVPHRPAMTPQAPNAPGDMNHILRILRARAGHDFSRYKKSTLGRRIERRMWQHNIEDTEIYARYLEETPSEVHSLFKELLINVTSFFRDPQTFVTLKEDVLPQLLAGKPAGYVFRAWVAGCATGEEAYSIAILLRELASETRQEFKVQLFSTDLDEEAITVARAGIYPLNIVQDVLPERLRRFFTREENGYRVKKNIRDGVVFAVQNVLADPPFTRLDLISCRNLMIYLEPELQDRLIRTFHDALRPGGALFLSPSETVGDHPDLFAAIHRKSRLYRATHSAVPARGMIAAGVAWAQSRDGGAPDPGPHAATKTGFAELAARALLENYAPASVVTDLSGNILYVHGETGTYLRPAPGHATLNVIDMARAGLQRNLRSAVRSAGTLGSPVLSRELSVKTDGDPATLILSVRPLPRPDSGEDLLLVSFQEVARAAPDATARAAEPGEARRVAELERDLADTKEHLEATIEEQQSAIEELKSINEEMQSTNEELQSSGEELETSKEELQSVNEELMTVNAELQAKIEQLTGMQNDMKNLMDNINIGAVFLDERLVIRRFTREAVRVYHLVVTDVGRPLRDIKSDLTGEEDLLATAQTVFETQVPFEGEVRTIGGAWYLARIQPYRTLDNAIEGVVLTFVPFTEMKHAQEALREARELAAGLVETVREPLLVLDGALQVVSASPSFYQHFHLTPEETLGHPLCELGSRQWDIPKLRELLETVLPRNRGFDGYVIEHDFPAIGMRRMELSARRIVGSAGDTQLILLAMEISDPHGRESA